jgi:hypothetical protein
MLEFWLKAAGTQYSSDLSWIFSEAQYADPAWDAWNEQRAAEARQRKADEDKAKADAARDAKNKKDRERRAAKKTADGDAVIAAPAQ